MSTKKFIEIKFIYFLKPNSSLAFFFFFSIREDEESSKSKSTLSFLSLSTGRVK